MNAKAESYTKQDYIHDELLKQIQSGEFPLNGKITSEEEISARYQCSRGTVGRAIIRLVQDGLVSRKPHDGTRVIKNSVHSSSSISLDAYAFIYPSDQHEGIW
jgi:DNA-binding GntR family transcriptional regulator